MRAIANRRLSLQCVCTAQRPRAPKPLPAAVPASCTQRDDASKLLAGYVQPELLDKEVSTQQVEVEAGHLDSKAAAEHQQVMQRLSAAAEAARVPQKLLAEHQEVLETVVPQGPQGSKLDSIRCGSRSPPAEASKESSKVHADEKAREVPPHDDVPHAILEAEDAPASPDAAAQDILWHQQQHHAAVPSDWQGNEGLFALYTNPSVYSRGERAQFVKLLLLPDQAAEFRQALDTRMRLHDLGWAYEGDAISVAKLSWVTQEEQQLQRELQQERQQAAQRERQQQERQEQERQEQERQQQERQEQEQADAEVACHEGGGCAQDSCTDGSSSGSMIKVEVSVEITVSPCHSAVLVGSHPSLGSWSVDDGVPLEWSAGHVWRGRFELPADCSSFEYKAVLWSCDGTMCEAGSHRQARLQGQPPCLTLEHRFRCHEPAL